MSEDLLNTIEEYEKEIERLNKELENLEKLNNTNYQSFIETNNIINKAIKYIKSNEKEYGSLEDNEKIILKILDKEVN